MRIRKRLKQQRTKRRQRLLRCLALKIRDTADLAALAKEYDAQITPMLNLK